MSDIDDLIHANELRRNLPTPEECRRRRTIAGLSLARVARVVGISKTALWEWEQGAAPLPAKALKPYHDLMEGLA